MRSMKYIVATLAVILLAAVSPTMAASIACVASGTPTTIDATEGATVTLTASPDSAEYTYDWTVGSALTVVAGGDGNKYVTFVVPPCSTTGSYDVQLVMNPTGTSATACKDTCLYTVSCGGLCACPTITDACIADATTWTYTCEDCPGIKCPESLFYEWWVSTAYGTTPVQGTQSTWGTKQVADSRTYTPSTAWTGFNVPTANDPKTNTWVTFIVRADTSIPQDGTPDTVVKWCAPEDVILYFNPQASMDSVVS